MRRPFLLLLLSATMMLPLGGYAVQKESPATEASEPDEALQQLGLDESSQQELYSQAMARLQERLRRYPTDYEASLLAALIRFKSGDINGALGELQQLTKRVPKFYLAHLIQGDLLLARARVVSDIGAAPVLGHVGAEQKTEIVHLREEAEARLNAYLDTLPQGRLPRSLLMLDSGVHNALVVDKTSHRLYVYHRGESGVPELRKDFYVSTGKLRGNKESSGDLRTPEGVYFIISHIPDDKLPDLYGIGAYPMNYPNEWDRHLGKTGYGIWLHGTEAAYYSRPPLDSEGCVVLPNLDLQSVSEYLQPGVTPIVVTNKVEWLERNEWQTLRNEVAKAIEQWRTDWAGSDVERYLGHYAKEFWSGSKGIKAWKARKRRVALGKTWQKVKLSDLSFYAYPKKAGEDHDMVVANFHQIYDSNNFSSELDKRIYLIREEGKWRVLYEGRQ
jgi:murein L,D-transpeptidase YafK